MTNLKTAFAATTMMALSAMMLLAALEPVATGQPETVQVAARAAPGFAA